MTMREAGEMTDIIRYENLTFPEVDALPRDIPIVIPLGEMTDADLIKRVQRQSRSSLCRPIGSACFPACRSALRAATWPSIASCSSA